MWQVLIYLQGSVTSSYQLDGTRQCVFILSAYVNWLVSSRLQLSSLIHSSLLNYLWITRHQLITRPNLPFQSIQIWPICTSPPGPLPKNWCRNASRDGNISVLKSIKVRFKRRLGVQAFMWFWKMMLLSFLEDESKIRVCFSCTIALVWKFCKMRHKRSFHFKFYP